MLGLGTLCATGRLRLVAVPTVVKALTEPNEVIHTFSSPNGHHTKLDKMGGGSEIQLPLKSVNFPLMMYLSRDHPITGAKHN